MATRIFFATDVHGSEMCWRKFINAGEYYRANVLILGGDLTGKAVLPIVPQEGGSFMAFCTDQEMILRTEKELDEFERTMRYSGYYPYRTTQQDVEELAANKQKLNEVIERLSIATMQRWLAFADERLKDTETTCFVAPGNDDNFNIDSLFDSKRVVNGEGKVLEIDEHHELMSSGWTNSTPWHTHRECSEEELGKKIEHVASMVRNVENSIFALHAPPFQSMLDMAPELDKSLKPVHAGKKLVPVGSVAAREKIAKYQPMLGLHGHIHESKGFYKIGRTICINPGSRYQAQILDGAIIDLGKEGVDNWYATSG